MPTFKLNGKKIQIPVAHLSATQVSMYLRCPEQYRRRYILGEKKAPDVFLIEGSTHHRTLQYNNETKIQTGQDVKAPRLVEFFNDAFSGNRKQIGDWLGEREDLVRARAKGMLGAYLKSVAPKVHPIKAEQKFDLSLGGIPVTGIIDLVERRSRGAIPGVSDYKITARAKSDRDAKTSLALGLYSLAEGGAATRLISVLRRGEVKTTSFINWPTRELRWLEEIFGTTAMAISAGVFPVCDPAGWWCTPRFCGFYHACRGKGKRTKVRS